MAGTTLTMAGAINRALRDAMTADDDVLVFGEDVGTLGGVFRVTDGLARDFGEQRCFDTPLAESGIVGFAVGMAMAGFRPVVEMQFDAFAYPAFEQIASHVAKMRNRTRGAVNLPIVIRVPYAGGIGGVEHHCDSSEAYYAHTPGLKVVTPATVEDAYSLLREAIADPDPVIFMEPKRLYWSKAEVELPVSARAVRARPRCGARVATSPSSPTGRASRSPRGRRGRAGRGLGRRGGRPAHHRAVRRRDGRGLGAADRAVRRDPGGAGLRRCRRGDRRRGCRSAAFHALHAPVLRVSGLDIPYPAPKLEHVHLPGVDRVLDAIARLQWDDAPDLRFAVGGAA